MKNFQCNFATQDTTESFAKLCDFQDVEIWRIYIHTHGTDSASTKISVQICNLRHHGISVLRFGEFFEGVFSMESAIQAKSQRMPYLCWLFSAKEPYETHYTYITYGFRMPSDAYLFPQKSH